jgi:hypothetical protein
LLVKKKKPEGLMYIESVDSETKFLKIVGVKISREKEMLNSLSLVTKRKNTSHFSKFSGTQILYIKGIGLST